jgi:hypothetical protein
MPQDPNVEGLVSQKTVQTIVLSLLPIAIIMVLYASYIHYMRSRFLEKKQVYLYRLCSCIRKLCTPTTMTRCSLTLCIWCVRLILGMNPPHLSSYLIVPFRLKPQMPQLHLLCI